MSNFGKLELPNLEDQIYSYIYSLLVMYLTVSVTDFTIMVGTSSTGDKHTISEWADGSKAEVD